MYIVAIISAVVLASCGGSIDEKSLEGRVASFADNDTNVFAIVITDLDKIIQKSGAFDGALPEQYASVAAPFKDALYASINLEKPLYFLLKGPLRSDNLDELVLFFEVKDIERLKKEFKQMDLNFSTDKTHSLAVKNELGIVISEGNIGMMVFNTNGNNVTAEKLRDLDKLSSKKVVNEKLINSLATKADIVLVSMLERVSKATKGFELSDETQVNLAASTVDSYVVSTMNFNDGQAEVELNFMFGEAMKKYLPLFQQNVSSNVFNSLGSGSPIMAMTMNLEFKKLFLSIYDNLDADDKSEIDQSLALVGGKDKMSNMFTGEVGVALFPSKDNTSNPIVNAYLGLNDGTYLKSLVTGFGPLVGMTTEANGSFRFNNDAIVKLDNQKMILSTDVVGFNELLQSKSSAIVMPSSFNLGNQPISLFVDFSKLDLKDFPPNSHTFITGMSFLQLEGSDKGVKVIVKAKDANKNMLRQMLELVVKSIEAKIDYKYDPYEDDFMTEEELEAFYSF